MGQKIDLTGKKFGKLLILEDGIIKTNAKGDKSMWCICLCDCGNKVLKRHQSFLDGTVLTHCGCEPHKHSRLYAAKQQTQQTEQNITRYPKDLFMSEEKYDALKKAEAIIKQWHQDFKKNKVNCKIGAVVYVE